jgi:hypothetical protein
MSELPTKIFQSYIKSLLPHKNSELLQYYDGNIFIGSPRKDRINIKLMIGGLSDSSYKKMEFKLP